MQANASLTTIQFGARNPAATAVIPWPEIIAGCFFALCLIGQTHSLASLTTRMDDSVEAGRGLEDSAAFQKDVNAAPIHRKLGFLGLFLLGGYCLATAPRNQRLQNPALLFVLALFLIWLAGSLMWSVDWRSTAREFVRIAVYTFVAVSLALRFRPRQLCFVVMLALLGSVMAACAASVTVGNFRPWVSGFRLHGTLHSNLLAHQALVVLLIAVALLPAARRVWFWRLVILSALSVILLTKTRGALASAILGVTAIQLIGKPVWSVAFLVSTLATFALAGALLVVMAGEHVQEQMQQVISLGRTKGVGTLTGRIPLWEAVWDESRGRHWQGHGYGAFWSTERTEELYEELQWYPRHSHSAYVHTILDLGYVGLGLLLALVATCLLAALRLYRLTGDVAYKFYFGFLVAGLLDGLVEVCYVSPRELGLFVCIVVMGLIIVHPTQNPSATSDSGSFKNLQPALPRPLQGNVGGVR